MIATNCFAKCEIQLPDKYHGITNAATRRSPEGKLLQLITDHEARELFGMNARFSAALRQGLYQRQFLEFETPVLRENFAAGAAHPFSTHHNALGKDVYLRLTSEIELKELLVGGFEKVFELAKSFRNERADRIHNPEFTLLEAYQAYTDYRKIMTLTQDLVTESVISAVGSSVIQYKGRGIDFGKPWEVISASEAMEKYCGFGLRDIPNLRTAQEKAKKLAIDASKLTYGHTVSKFLETIIQPQIVDPTFVVYLPAEMSPLVKPLQANPCLTERAWVFAGGLFFCDIYSDLTDPDKLQARFEQQDEELGTTNTIHANNNLVKIAKAGMPPSAGFGLSVSRFAMLLMNKDHILDTIVFPKEL